MVTRKLMGLLWMLFTTTVANATDYFWNVTGQPISQTYLSADAACHAEYAKNLAIQQASPGHIPMPYKAPYPQAPGSETFFVCDLYYIDAPTGHKAGGVATMYRNGNGCSDGASYDALLGLCESPVDPLSRKQLGFPRDPLGGEGICHADPVRQGDPINILTGNEFEEESDYVDADGELRFSHIYNSYDGQWHHNYGTRLFIGSTSLALSFADGQSSLFTLNGGTATPESTELGSLVKASNMWVYVSPSNETLTFDSLGRLTRRQARNGLAQTLGYSATSGGSTQVTVMDSQGRTLLFQESGDHRPMSLIVGNLSVAYSYNSFGELTSVTYTRSTQVTTRTYAYEDSRSQNWLTGITDERGVRYATWHYDAWGRAISSEHANGAEKVTLTYNDDGSTTVTNALGHAVTYRYQVIQGIKHITSIEGEPAAGCPASNSSYTYNTIGQVATKTDALGHITAYTYDTLGRETQRVEAQGTPQARTTTTTWHGTSFLPETVTTADHVTTYTYDTQNRLLSTSTHAAQGSVP